MLRMLWLPSGPPHANIRDTIGKPLLRGNLLLILLLISGDLSLFQALMNAEDNFKSSGHIENKRHTNTHQLSPASQQQRLQSPPLRHSSESQ